jgi:hypothetical protein
MFVDGFTYGTNHPKIKPEIAPQSGPSRGAVNAEKTIPDNVITAGVPKIGYVGINANAKFRAVQTPVKAGRKAFAKYFRNTLSHFMYYW